MMFTLGDDAGMW